MTTLNTTHRARKFFLCVHQTSSDSIGFEKVEDRFTQFTYLCYGHGKFHFFFDDDIVTVDGQTPRKLYDLRKYVNCNVVIQTKMNSRIISFNPWRKNQEWVGRLLDKNEKIIKTDKEYACIVCFEGNPIINGKEFKELDFADIVKNNQYTVEMEDDANIGFFELVSS